MGIPILSDIFGLVGGIVDKIFPDKDTKIKAEYQGKVLELTRDQLKADLQRNLLETAYNEKKLIFQDMDSARQMYMAELQEKDVPKFAKAWRALNRPILTTLIVGMWAFNKIIPLIDPNLPHVEWGNWDSVAMTTIVGFYFGVRTAEKITGNAK